MKNEQKIPCIKNIEVGKFYFIHDGSRTGHPGFVLWKDDAANRYLVVRFDSDKPGDIPKKDRGVKHITKLSRPTSKFVINSYVHNRPMLCKRKDIGSELTELSLSQEDYLLIKRIGMAKRELSPSFK